MNSWRLERLNFNWRQALWMGLAAALSLGGYLLASGWYYRLGFPLDDAWIHQTYARNLALYGEWAFYHGQPSAGSTAPLWSALLAPGYWLHLAPAAWAYGLGWLLLALTALTGISVFHLLCPEQRRWARWMGVILALEWHLVWAAGSGMETLLAAWLALLVLGLLAAGWRNWLAIGLLIGLSVWVRPDGITLLGPAALVSLLDEKSWNGRLRAWGSLALGLALLFGPYLLFNRLLAGAWWPNTFFAKQAEYAIHRSQPFWLRLAQQASLPLIGAGVLALPGFIFLLVDALRRRAWAVLAGAAWVGGYLLLYALRLPVTYQHGRYIMPVIPVYLVWAWAGMAILTREMMRSSAGRILSSAWIISTLLVLLGFWGMGAQAYAQDSAVIESEMVQTAQWLDENTPPDALIAVHDIGAVGYFTRRRLLDLAGLVSPEVIPFIRDEGRLEQFLDEQGATHLVTFPGWYPALVKRGSQVYTTEGAFSPELGGENMHVYLWKRP